MDASGSHKSNRAYYDAFSERYEDHRGGNDPGGYHDLVDQLESEFVERYGRNKDVLEVGCGTGLVLERLSRFARTAKGVDLSPGMLERARGRGLDVVEGSATELPFEAAAFDVTCSFKVLAHVPDIRLALSEMARVTRPGGVVVAEFYNPMSLRGLVRRFGPAGRIATGTNESNVYTRFDAPAAVRAMAPRGCRFSAARGVRIVTPAAAFLRVPGLGIALSTAERALCDSPLSMFGGFFIAAFVKEGGAA
jgi:ubiquinone/menaquinone biosynthesis C-methylase UbiE